ncbi:hypothetical protein BDY21DRAFT_359 [Lineolata rhizophorae]|uniref:Uncharacterized protein n=1 Tax=Lineolata rhizophorae TaxID=578093 RepID=A0A6A6PED6_9PEZI|nr:hypothetical protein BDY21DRAFT_359 [Lineolata rhizophorae]
MDELNADVYRLPWVHSRQIHPLHGRMSEPSAQQHASHPGHPIGQLQRWLPKRFGRDSQRQGRWGGRHSRWRPADAGWLVDLVHVGWVFNWTVPSWAAGFCGVADGPVPGETSPLPVRGIGAVLGTLGDLGRQNVLRPPRRSPLCIFG